jgi:trehalose/maltose hydrolase-like predicted phosphorylase
MASLAGTWTALVQGFGGLRDDEGVLALDPALPGPIARLTLRLRWRGFRLTVTITHHDVTYTVRDGPGGTVAIRHAGQDIEVEADEPAVVPLSPRRPLSPHPPEQPPGLRPPPRTSSSTEG